MLALSGAAQAATSRDRLTLLIPDGASLSSWQVQVWTDSAAEEGIQIRTMTDSAFLALGANAVNTIAGLILPDSAHIQASDALVAAVKQYVNAGGQLMLTYDAGALTDSGVYSLTGKSRFSDLVGVDYVQYDLLRDRVVGFGPIVGSKGRMENLSLPPGKYMPYVADTGSAAAAVATAGPANAVFVPTNRFDPGGSQFMRSLIEARARGGSPSLARLSAAATSATQLRYDLRVGNATQALAQLQSQLRTGSTAASLRQGDDVSAVVNADGSNWSENAPAVTASRLASSDAAMQSISGYGFGELSYYHFVTTGTFPGKVFLTSPQHGLVAGERDYGSGKVLFVNIPLGYFKAIGTDGVLIQGFLNHFARDQVVMPRLSVQPRGVGGLVYNWHVDDGDDIVPQFRSLMAMDFMQNQGPFTVHFTAGPDVVTLGDGAGMNLPNNPAAQAVVAKTAKVGWYARGYGMPHEIGSHGGWNHDLYGLNANETNADTYLPWLVLNFNAIEDVTNQRLRAYSAPVGNNPTWATQWLERRGVVGMYTVSNTGAAATREWRSGERLTNKLWAMPIAPLGKSATFEEFELDGVTDRTSAQWLVDLQSFVVNNRTNRLFYNHPPGALGHLGVVKTFVRRAATLQSAGRFKWYTMAELADFSQRRLQTTWSASGTAGWINFTGYNPVSLTDVTWLLPRSEYTMPAVISGSGSVSTTDSKNWVVTAKSGTSITFMAWKL
ncbi:hypothetical protein RD110_08240 [Rhodoferax koreense]|uniref:Uncharacterized protein n=1 Tax=Rhodoferax koreensis TaxID=1842727 RepID=A0A1P8JTV2_9BURK|nr:hypothetical protein [Rhodoferax koreense]APW37189.1 hypothetical protein RD110_08240 [Rhodoferax koreense]